MLDRRRWRLTMHIDCCDGQLALRAGCGDFMRDSNEGEYVSDGYGISLLDWQNEIFKDVVRPIAFHAFPGTAHKLGPVSGFPYLGSYLVKLLSS